MKRAKLKIEILTVIFCSLIFAFSEKNNSIYADEVLTDMELPTGRLLFEEETEEAADEDYESIEESDIAEQSLLRTADIAADDWNKYGSDYFYDQLSDEEKAYWNALDVICEKYLTTETDAVTTKSGAYRMQAISGSTLAKAQQKNVLLMFRYSNPQYYFLNATVYTISYSNDTISLVFGIYPAFENGTDRMEKTEKVKKQVDAWQEQIDQCSKDYEKVKKIHDLICEKVYYNQALVNSDFATESTEYSQSVYSVFCTDKTVCAGYAQSFAMMCNGSGIDTAVVTSSNHEWNKVKICSSWYNVDCTWDDQSDGYYYNFFVKSDEFYDTYSSWSKTCHTEEDYWEWYLPVCTLDSGATQTDPGKIPIEGHTIVTDAAVAASCETTGLTEGSHCSVCKTVLVAQTVIPAAGHKWSEYRESGKVKRKCSVCGKTETVRTLPKVKTVQLSKTSYTYDGKSHMPTVKVTNSAGKKLKEGTDYKIKKPSGRKNAGIYTVTIEMKGDYTGKYQKTFQIIPKGTAISSVKAKKKAFSVSWKKQAKQTSGYQIQYAVDAKFKKSVVTKNVNNTKKVKLDVSKLKAKKKYYIRVRTYKTVKVNGKSKKIYSGWSKVKAVTTKK